MPTKPKAPMLDVMVDLETLGNIPGSTILSIGAVFFDAESQKLGAEFYAVLDRASCAKAGLIEVPATLLWWAKQSTYARTVLKEAEGRSAYKLGIGLATFGSWLLKNAAPRADKVRVWGNGADFDNAFLACAYAAVGREPPWAFYHSRCFRTLKNLLPEVIPAIREGTYHNALDDAKHQARHALKLLWVLSDRAEMAEQIRQEALERLAKRRKEQV